MLYISLRLTYLLTKTAVSEMMTMQIWNSKLGFSFSYFSIQVTNDLNELIMKVG